MKPHRRTDATFTRELKPAVTDSIWKIRWLNSKTRGTPSAASPWRGMIQLIGTGFKFIPSIKEKKKVLSLEMHPLCFWFALPQATQAGGSAALLRQVHWCSPGPEWLAVPSGAPAGRGRPCLWRQRHSTQPDRQTQGTTHITQFNVSQQRFTLFKKSKLLQ